MTGRSVHNQRIERLWLECLHFNFLWTFHVISKTLFKTLINTNTFFFHRKMERKGILSSISELDLYCLHVIFLPIIQQHVEEFVDAWNLHSIRTAPSSMSPVRMFMRGLTSLRRRSVLERRRFTELVQVSVFKVEICFVIIWNASFIKIGYWFWAIYWGRPVQDV
jgi:hypothetical protein